jgi:integrase
VLARGYQARDTLLSPNLVLFPSRKGTNKAITPVQAYQIFQRACDACGLAGRLGTHSMRKTFAITMYQRLNENIFKVQQALGHKWITSTQAYLPVNEAEISAAILA